MAHINLLPWREELRKKRQRNFGGMLLGALVVGALIVAAAYFIVEQQIDFQNQRNRYLQKEIELVEQKIREIKDLEREKARLLARMDVIQRLQKSRPEIVHLFDDLVTTLPEGVYLVDIVQAGGRLTLTGRAQSNARVSAYMRKIDAADWIGGSRLQVIESTDKTGTGLSHFQLTASQVTKKEGGEPQ